MALTGLRASLSIQDWLELLELDSLFEELRLGATSLSDAAQAIDHRRERWPNLTLDWMRALDSVEDMLEGVRRAVHRQNDTLDGLARQLSAAGESLSWDRDRLLTPVEREEIRRLQQQLESAAEEAREAARQAERAAEAMEDDQQRLEGLREELEERRAEIEDAIEAQERS